MPVLPLLHVPPDEPSVKFAAAPKHTKVLPVIGSIGLTVTVVVVLQPVVAAKYVIVAVPPAILVTTPLLLPTVATPVLLLLHVPDPEGSLRVMEDPAHIGVLPV